MNLKSLALIVALTMGNAMALNVLTFDTGNPERNTTVGALGFSMTQVGAESISELDFTLFDVIYVAQSYDEFFSSGVGGALTSRADDLTAYLASGGGIVFGSPEIGGLGGFMPVTTGDPITTGVDLGTLGLATLPVLPGLTSNAENLGGVPAVPEPGTIALMGLGLAGILVLRRKSKSKV